MVLTPTCGHSRSAVEETWRFPWPPSSVASDGISIVGCREEKQKGMMQSLFVHWAAERAIAPMAAPLDYPSSLLASPHLVLCMVAAGDRWDDGSGAN
jgi:hypothetical protein